MIQRKKNYNIFQQTFFIEYLIRTKTNTQNTQERNKNGQRSQSDGSNQQKTH